MELSPAPFLLSADDNFLPPQASVLDNLRLAVRSQLGLPSLRPPSWLWLRLFPSPPATGSAPLALVSADLDGSSSSASSDPPPSPTNWDDAEGGATASSVAPPLPHKAPPPLLPRVREAPTPVAVVTDPSPTPSHLQPPPTASSALQRLARRLRRLTRSLSGAGHNQDQGPANHSPMRQLEAGRGVAGGTVERQSTSREDEEDVELLVPDSSSGSSSDPPLPPSSSSGPVPRRGPCDHCGMVHTARIPARCQEASGHCESSSSDDELLLLC